MEIEAKFCVADASVFAELRALSSLGSYVLTPGEIQELADTYLDTPARRLCQAGYACRMRRWRDKLILTLKGVHADHTAQTLGIHRREEFEVELVGANAPAPAACVSAWPQSAVRRKALDLVGREALTPWFTLTQVRHARLLLEGSRRVAEFCLDEVRIEGDPSGQLFLGLEIELVADGDESDLDAIMGELGRWQGLSPQTESKFELALAVLGEVDHTYERYKQ